MYVSVCAHGCVEGVRRESEAGEEAEGVRGGDSEVLLKGGKRHKGLFLA